MNDDPRRAASTPSKKEKGAMGGLSALAESLPGKGGQAAHGTRNGKSRPFQGAVGYHGMALVAAVVVLAGASILSTGSDGRVRDPWFGIRLPNLCALKRTTGYDCPGCGLTRCFIAMGHGQWRRAFRYYPVGTAIFVVVAAQIPYRAIQLWRLAHGKNDLDHAALLAIPVLIVAAMVVQWLWKMLLLVRS